MVSYGKTREDLYIKLSLCVSPYANISHNLEHSTPQVEKCLGEIHTYSVRSVPTHTCMHIHIHARIHARTHIHTHAHTHACTHPRMHAHTHTHIHMYAHTYTHTHIHSRVFEYLSEIDIAILTYVRRPFHTCNYQISGNHYHKLA